MVSKFKKNILSASLFAPKVAPQKPPPGVPDFGRIHARDMQFILEIANRASRIAQAHRLARDPRDTVVEVNPEIVAVDVAIVHLQRGLKLQAFHECDDLTFMQEYAAIEKNLDRATKFFPAHVALRFALSGEKIGANFIN